MMSRAKIRPSGDVCADCGASDPSWASINRGLLLCAECCSVHRSMGRHISHVKSLRQGSWPPSLLAMVHALTAQNVNGIWEHSLLDSTASKHLRRKPQSKDALHPTKSEFILAKHHRLAYVLRPRRDEPVSELGRQLHSAVRSCSLDTSMRLLAQGADPNYFNKEKGTSCLHVACRAGHAAQAELLVAWGADPNVRDVHSHSPADCARQGGYNELAERMVELCYEVTDRMIFFLTSTRPEHAAGQHFLVPDVAGAHEMTDLAKAARGKLQLLPNHLFEELVMDIYDEIDRRETEAVWQTSAMGLERNGVAFLPVNPALSAPRNQGRQKLARLSLSEVATLIRDVLLDATRRQHMATLKPQTLLNSMLASQLRHLSQMSDDEPLYDSVAEDDDYAALLPTKDDAHNSLPQPGETVSSLYNPSIPNENSSAVQMRNAPSSLNSFSLNTNNTDQTIEIENLRKELDSKDNTIAELKAQLRKLQLIVEKLTDEHSAQSTKNVSPSGENGQPAYSSTSAYNHTGQESINDNNSHVDGKVNNKSIERGHSLENENAVGDENTSDAKEQPKPIQRPASMYETREGLKLNFQVSKHQLTAISGMERAMSQGVSSSPLSLPPAEAVHAHAERVTRCIQELWGAMQEARAPLGQGFTTRAHTIKETVAQLMAIFPEKCADRQIAMALGDMAWSCERVVGACASPSPPPLHVLRAAAYDLAKATKTLVTYFQLPHQHHSSTHTS